MVTTISREIPSTGYGIRKITAGKDSVGRYLRVELASADLTDPSSQREDFATHIETYLKTTNGQPGLQYKVEPLSGGQIQSVIGYEQCSLNQVRNGKLGQALIGVNVISGKKREREVIIQPVIHSNGFLKNYMGVLERDLVSE